MLTHRGFAPQTGLWALSAVGAGSGGRLESPQPLGSEVTPPPPSSRLRRLESGRSSPDTQHLPSCSGGGLRLFSGSPKGGLTRLTLARQVHDAFLDGGSAAGGSAAVRVCAVERLPGELRTEPPSGRCLPWSRALFSAELRKERG